MTIPVSCLPFSGSAHRLGPTHFLSQRVAGRFANAVASPLLLGMALCLAATCGALAQAPVLPPVESGEAPADAPRTAAPNPSGSEPAGSDSAGADGSGGDSVGADLSAVVDAIIRRTNEFRESKDLPPLEPEASLTKAAEQFAQFMADTDKYGHRADGRTPAQRAEAAGYDYCVVRENIAYRTNTGEVTVESLTEVFVQGWIDSPPHRENMLADYATHTGVGVASDDGATFYAVQLFGRPKSAAYRVKLMNQSGQMQTVRFRADDQQDEVELQPRMTLTLSRCLPTVISIADQDASVRVAHSATYHVTDQGLKKVDSEPTE